jgi:hypothetical protein
MGYKFLGFVVWQGLKLYLRRNQAGLTRKLAIGAAAGTAMLIGGVVAQRRLSSDD